VLHVLFYNVCTVIVNGHSYRHDGSQQRPSSRGVYVVSVVVSLKEDDATVIVAVVDGHWDGTSGRRRRGQVADVSAAREGHADV